MYALNTADLKTLAIVADPEAVAAPCRTTLEKLSRLQLIEPCNDGVCLSPKGREMLTKKN